MHPSLVDVHTGLCKYRDDKLLMVYGGRDLCVIDARGIIEKRLVLPTPGYDYHGIAWDGEKIFLANTIYNEVVILKEDVLFEQNLYGMLIDVQQCPLFPGANLVDDACHLNSIAIGSNLYVTVFDYSDKPESVRTEEGWRESCEGQIMMMDYWVDGKRTIKSVIQGLNKPHSLIVEGKDAWVCNSGTGSLIHFQFKTGAYNVWQLTKDRWLRGLARDSQGNLYIGFSVYRHIEDSPVKRSYISQLTSDGEHINRWYIPPQEVYDIVILEE